MGTVYRRQVKFCTTCRRRLDTTAAWQACQAAGHAIETRAQRTWWFKYHVGGRPHCVSSNSEKKADATRLLKAREGDVVKGVPITASVGRVTFEDAAADLLNDYTTNRRRSLRVVELRLKKHLTPFFGHRRLMTITTADVRAFTARRQAAGASNASINRDLILLKRMGTLAMQAGKLTVRPYIPLLKETNIRKGFFEPE
jgi:integrase family protein with SAM-like domain